MRHNSIRIVDNLAEITSHLDRHVLEKSLLKTLNDSFPAESLQLFRVSEKPDGHELSLLAFCVNGVIESNGDNPKLLDADTDLSASIELAINHQDVETIAKPSGGWYVVYPAFDNHNDIFAILLISTEQAPTRADLRLVHGILRVYTNYLALIERIHRDKLTGLFNRETLDDEITKILVRQNNQLEKEMSSPNDARRRPFAIKHWLGVMDIDHFKSINDSYGHLYGDEVLILVARLMKSGVIRDDDLIFRYGGEEFVVLLKAANEDDAMLTFERIRKKIADHHFPQLKQVTVSIGFVEVAGQQSPSDAIGEADEALYYAKHNGRNQVQNYQQLLEQGIIENVSKTAEGDVELF